MSGPGAVTPSPGSPIGWTCRYARSAARSATRWPYAPRYGCKSVTGLPPPLTDNVNIDGSRALADPLSVTVYPSTTDVAATGGSGCGSYSPLTCTLAPSVTEGPPAGVTSANTR